MGLKGEYGYFDAAEREFVITRPDTPRPWYNYLMNDEFVSMISNTGGGVAYYKDPRIHRLLRYRYQNVPYDRPGRYIYLRDNDTGDYWSATWAPCWTKGGEYRCRVGANYQIVSYELNGIAVETTYFVPHDRPLEIWDVKIINTSGRPRDISTYSYAEFAFWGAMRDLMNIDNCPKISRQRYDSENGAILHYSWNDIGTGLNDMNFVQNYGFHRASVMPDGYNGDRDLFLGIYRDERDPLVVERGESTNYCENGGYPIGSLEHRHRLAPGETTRVVFQTGYAADEDEYRRTSAKYAEPDAVDQAFVELRSYWTGIFDKFKIETPDTEFDAVVNSFIQYQAAMTLVLSRSISSYEWGIGRAIGFRDSCQDQLGMMHAMPERAAAMLRNLCEAVHPDGSAAHNSNPLTGKYGYSGFYDDHNWLAVSVAEFVKETGRMEFLDEDSRFCQSDERGSVYEHLRRCQNHAWSLRGANGLLQTGHADWNDSLNPGDKETESIFTSLLYCASTKALAELAELRGDEEWSRELRARYDEIKELCDSVGWDGEWYKRMIKTDGVTLGSKESGQWGFGTIFLEPQPWSVFSGVAGRDRAVSALDAAEEKLGTPRGHRVIDRGFDHYDPDMGSCGIFPPGVKENAAVFNHASSWMISAEALLGRGGKAMEYFKRMCATTKNAMAETHQVEPYVVCQFVCEPPFHAVGRGYNPWLTGTAAWMARGAMWGIVGCRPDYDGLEINPSIPADWPGFKLTREFRGAVYEIEVRNPDGVESGVAAMTVDGETVENGKITFNPEHVGRIVPVEVVMG